MKNREQDHSRENGENGCASPHIWPDGNVHVDKISDARSELSKTLKQFNNIRDTYKPSMYLSGSVDIALQSYLSGRMEQFMETYNFILKELLEENDIWVIKILSRTKALLDILK